MLPTTVLILQAQEAIKYNGIFMSNTWGQDIQCTPLYGHKWARKNGCINPLAPEPPVTAPADPGPLNPL